MEERDDAQTQDRVRKIQQRKHNKSKVQFKEALKSDEILQGTYEVVDLKDSQDTIGDMEHMCQYCGALKFKKETSSTCCGNGKVILPRFPTPPKQIH